MEVFINNISQTELEQQAYDLAAFVKAPLCIALWGEMGAGKSTFARAFIQALLPGTEVPSPTFTLIQTYTTPKSEIWHCDLYRLTNSHEIEELGLLEAFKEHICLVEWPQRLVGLLPQPRYNVFIETNNVKFRNYRCEYLL